MDAKRPEDDKQGISKVKLALGAASLFLFIVGLKRTFKTDDAPAEQSSPAAPGQAGKDQA